ncbi:MAG: hypothetical protein OXH01_04165 [Bacteroidetes bacterium]|nr:hypothetical protein [Bacteroidota bacterium]
MGFVIDQLLRSGVHAWALKDSDAAAGPRRGAHLATVDANGALTNNTEITAHNWSVTDAGEEADLGRVSGNRHRLALPRRPGASIRGYEAVVHLANGTEYDMGIVPVGGRPADETIVLKAGSAVALGLRCTVSETTDVRYLSVYGRGDTVASGVEIRLYASH